MDKGETWRSVGVGCMEEWRKGVVKLGKGGQQPHSVGKGKVVELREIQRFCWGRSRRRGGLLEDWKWQR